VQHTGTFLGDRLKRSPHAIGPLSCLSVLSDKLVYYAKRLDGSRWNLACR